MVSQRWMSLSSFSAGMVVIFQMHGKEPREDRRALRAAPATAIATLTRACLQFVGFAQPRIADFDPLEAFAARCGQKHHIVQAGARRRFDDAGEQPNCAVYRP